MSELTVKEIALSTLTHLHNQITYESVQGKTLVNEVIVDRITSLLATPVVIDMYHFSK